MNAIQLRRKVERMKAARDARQTQWLAHAVIDNVDRTTPGGFRGSRSGLGAWFSTGGTLLGILLMVIILLAAMSSFVRAAP